MAQVLQYQVLCHNRHHYIYGGVVNRFPRYGHRLGAIVEYLQSDRHDMSRCWGGDSTQHNAMQLNHAPSNCKQPYHVQLGHVQLDCVQWNIRGSSI